jgi:hypothetical protein
MKKQGLEWLWHLPARGRVINLQKLPALYIKVSKGYTPEGKTEKKYYQSPFSLF